MRVPIILLLSAGNLWLAGFLVAQGWGGIPPQPEPPQLPVFLLGLLLTVPTAYLAARIEFSFFRTVNSHPKNSNGKGAR